MAVAPGRARLPGPLLVAVGVCPLAPLVLVHLQAAFLFQIAHGGEVRVACEARGGSGLGVERGVEGGLEAAGPVLVDNVGLGRTVVGGDCGVHRLAGGSGVIPFKRGARLLGERLEPGLHTPVVQGAIRRLASFFLC